MAYERTSETIIISEVSRVPLKPSQAAIRTDKITYARQKSMGGYLIGYD